MRSRLAHALLKKEPQTAVTVFLMADAVVAAKAGQKTPDGYYNVERMLKRVLASKGEVLLCGTCMDARGLDDACSYGRCAPQHHGRACGCDDRGDKVMAF